MSLLAALLLWSTQPALANQGDCGWVRGRYDVANGSRIHRIWVVGTNHMLSLDVPDEGVMRPPLKSYYDTGRFRPFRNQMLADFYVCSAEKRLPGHMQRVRLKRLKNVRIVRY